MTIKKAELHVHLEGTIAPNLALKLAARNKLSIPQGLITADGSGYYSKDFLHFLSVYDTLADLIKTPEDYYDVTYDYLKSCAQEGAIYVEMMYSPDHAEKTTNATSLENLHAVQQAIDDAEHKHNIIGRILITAVRHFGVESCTSVAKRAEVETVPAVVGFGLGGDELGYPPRLFEKVFKIAADAGLQCTAHAGEFGSASTIIDAVDSLNLKRIGHGVQCITSPEVMDILQERKIALEICPSSNIKFNLFTDLHNHPIQVFYERGMQISINSDDPPFMNTSIGQEYNRVQSAFGYDNNVMHNITKMAIESSFADAATKEKLLRQLLA